MCVQFEFEWISTHDNIYADALSRPEGEQRFLALVRSRMPELVGKLARHASSGAVRQFGPEYPSDVTGDGPVSFELALMRVLGCLRGAPTHQERLRHLDGVARLHGRRPNDAERRAISIVLVAVHGWGLPGW